MPVQALVFSYFMMSMTEMTVSEEGKSIAAMMLIGLVLFVIAFEFLLLVFK